MQTKSLLLSLLCLFLLSATGYAQPNFAELRQSPMMQQSMKMGVKATLRSFWDGSGSGLMTIGLLNIPEFRQAVGVSDEQYQEIQSAQMNIGAALQAHPEYQEIMAEMQAIQDPMDPLMHNADEETLNQFMNVQERVMPLVMEIQAETIDGLLTPEQREKTAEALLANMGEMPIISPDMFEILDLTDAQREQMEEIKKELEPAFEQLIEDFTESSVLVANKMFDEFEKQRILEELDNIGGDRQKMEEFGKKSQEIVQKLAEDDPEFKRINDGMHTKGKTFAVQFQTKMFDVLTDEQWKRLQELTDNPPEHAKVLLAQLKKQRGETDDAAASAGSWQPGPDSWRPGVAIPEQYRQERNTRGSFPRPQ